MWQRLFYRISNLLWFNNSFNVLCSFWYKYSYSAAGKYQHFEIENIRTVNSKLFDYEATDPDLDPTLTFAITGNCCWCSPCINRRWWTEIFEENGPMMIFCVLSTAERFLNYACFFRTSWLLSYLGLYESQILPRNIVIQNFSSWYLY